jgi:hypothetical protein
MAKSKIIRVTPNVQECLQILKAAVKSMADGDLKKDAEGALGYLSRAFKGEPQPGRGQNCPGGTRFIKS